MDTVKLKCYKIVDDYERSYKKVAVDQKEIQSSTNALQSFCQGQQMISYLCPELNSLAPASARMMIAYNDYILTEQDVRSYFEGQLGI